MFENHAFSSELAISFSPALNGFLLACGAGEESGADHFLRRRLLLHGICEWAVHTTVDADGLEGIDCIVYGVGLSYDDKYSVSALGP